MVAEIRLSLKANGNQPSVSLEKALLGFFLDVFGNNGSFFTDRLLRLLHERT